jgi:hypothetical protein
MTAEFNAAVDLVSLPSPEVSREETDKQLAAQRGEFVEGISNPADPKWVKDALQPQVENLGGGVFSIDGLMNEKQSKKMTVHRLMKDPPAMCRWKKLAVMKPRTVLRYQRARRKLSQAQALLKLIAAQLP